MGKTFRASQRARIAPKRLTGRKKRELLPAGARKFGRAQKIAELERIAKRRGRDFDPKYYAMCHQKVRYKTKEETNRDVNLAGLMIPYKCNYCVYWHIGRRPRSDPLSNDHLWPGKDRNKGAK